VERDRIETASLLLADVEPSRSIDSYAAAGSRVTSASYSDTRISPSNLRIGVVESVVIGSEPLRVAADIGFDGVEVVLPVASTGEALALVAGAQARTNVAIPSIIVGAHNVHGGVADTDPVVALRARDDVRRALAWADALGADTILVPFFLAADLTSDEAVERCASAFAQLCPDAERAGVTLCFEGSLPADAVVALAQRVDSQAFGCYFDPANLVVAGLDPESEARTLGTLIRRVHLKDTREGRGDCRLGEGRVDFTSCAAALADIGYDGWLVVEGPPGDAEAIARDLSFVQSFVPALRQ
jgi:sugar phosphate isomerase/epimerase